MNTSIHQEPDYGELQVRTRPNTSARLKSKVLLVMHPEDRMQYEDIITDEILKAADCALYMLKPDEETEMASGRKPVSEHLENIGEMRLIVAVISKRFLREDSFAKSMQIPSALKQNVAILPIVAENGLVSLFNEDPLFKGLQYLNRASQDSTEIGYEVKLKKYLDQMLVNSDEVKKIRKHYTGHVFLSYRKKDRTYAKNLMSILHDIRKDLAIWYDEFLTPGKHYSEEIENTISQSDLFTMAMTPYMLEKPNYVEEHEYRAAVRSGKDILPVQVKDIGKADPEEVYPGIGTCLDAADKDKIEERIKSCESKFKGYTGDTESAEHKYMVALGYLNGIENEIDGARAEELLKEAASQKEGRYSIESYRKLVLMYVNGAGAERNRSAAKETQAELVSYLRETLDNTDDINYTADFLNEWTILGDLYYNDSELDKAEEHYTKVSACIREAVLNSSLSKDPAFCSAIWENGTTSFTRLGVILKTRGEDDAAKRILTDGSAVEDRLNQTLDSRKEATELEKFYSEIIHNENAANAEAAGGNYTKAEELVLKNAHMMEEKLASYKGSTEYAELRGHFLPGITGWYSRAANNAIAAGKYDRAEAHCMASLAAFEELGGQLRLMGSTDIQGEIFWTYFHLSEIANAQNSIFAWRDYLKKARGVLEEILEQSGERKWADFLGKVKFRLAAAEAACSREEARAKENNWIIGEDIPF